MKRPSKRVFLSAIELGKRWYVPVSFSQIVSIVFKCLLILVFLLVVFLWTPFPSCRRCVFCITRRKPLNPNVPHAPKRPVVLSKEEFVQAVQNALRYFPEKYHAILGPEFAEELKTYGHIYMYR